MPKAGMPRSPSEQGGKRAAPSASARKAASAKGLTGLKGRAYVGAAINRAKEEKREARAEGAKKGMGKPPANPKPRARKAKKTTPEDEEVKRARAQLAAARTAKANRAKSEREERLANTPERKVQQLEARRTHLLSDKRAIEEAIRQIRSEPRITRPKSAHEAQDAGLAAMRRVDQIGKLKDRLEATDAELAKIDKKLLEIRHARTSRRPSPEMNAAALRAAAEERAHARGRRK